LKLTTKRILKRHTDETGQGPANIYLAKQNKVERNKKGKREHPPAHRGWELRV
jgi:hypothetical protein